jgi:hypothetical protein
LQQLALFAIPQTDYLDESDHEDVDSDVAHVSHAALLESVQTSEASSSADSLAVFDELQENPALSDADSADITVPPPLETGDGDDTFWDYVTPKYQEARAALAEGQIIASLMAPQSNSDNEIWIDHVLRHINKNLRVTACDNRSFIPRHALRRFLTHDMVKKLLKITCMNSLKWEAVCNKYLTVFVILLSIDQGAYIMHFLRYNYLADAFLPFNDQTNWPLTCRKFFEAFDKIQWEFCAQELGSDDLDDKEFDSRIIVPIISREPLKSGDSRTSKVEVHPDYNCLSPAVRFSGTFVN